MRLSSSSCCPNTQIVSHLSLFQVRFSNALCILIATQNYPQYITLLLKLARVVFCTYKQRILNDTDVEMKVRVDGWRNGRSEGVSEVKGPSSEHVDECSTAHGRTS